MHIRPAIRLTSTVRKNTSMNVKITLTTLVAAAVISSGCESHRHHNHAKISKEQATQIVSSQVPGGTVKEGELEKEGGRWIWSFDVATAGTANITEIHVDANTGEIVRKEIETPKDEASEAKSEGKKHKKKDKDDDDEKDEKK
jgi:hypothetical protein